MRRYSLFGDPLQRLALPRYQVELEIDKPMSALGVVEVSGQVLDETGQPAEDYNGHAWLQAFDSGEMSLLDGLRYRQVGAYIFRGKYEVVRGRFSGQFRVPKDISYGGVEGRISAYAWSGEAPTAYGALEDLLIAGTALTWCRTQKARGFALDLRKRLSAAETALPDSQRFGSLSRTRAVST